MVVICEDLIDPSLAAHFHRNAVGQTVALIKARPVELDAVVKNMRRLLDDLNVRIQQESLNN